MTDHDLQVGETEILEAAGPRPVRVHERTQGQVAGPAASAGAARQLRLQIRPPPLGRGTPDADWTHLRSEDAQVTPPLPYRVQCSGLINTDAQIGVVVTGERSE